MLLPGCFLIAHGRSKAIIMLTVTDVLHVAWNHTLQIYACEIQYNLGPEFSLYAQTTKV